MALAQRTTPWGKVIISMSAFISTVLFLYYILPMIPKQLDANIIFRENTQSSSSIWIEPKKCYAVAF